MQIGINDDDSKVCQWEGCTEIDLLSTQCTNCHGTFCSRHISNSAHHCHAVRDATVLECPLCSRTVLLEYPAQRADEAVSRHMDRGCSDLPRRSAQPSLRNGTGGGHRLGGGPSVPPCGTPGCNPVSHVRVKCERCARNFCVDHRDPEKHHCCVERRTASPVVASPLIPRPKKTPAPLAQVIQCPSNTPATAVGKATENPDDMVTPLIVFLIPARETAHSSEQPWAESIPPFYMHLYKNLAMGTVVDRAVSEAAKGTSHLRPTEPQPWKVYVVPLPLPKGVTTMNAYPEVPLGTLVRRTPLVTASQCAVLISIFECLPEAALHPLMMLTGETKRGTTSNGCCPTGDSCTTL